MIVKRQLSWIRMLFSYHGSALARTVLRIIAVTLFSVVVTTAQLLTNIEAYSLTVTPFTLIGLALAIFLGFRNNAAYDRYWEGRKLWGQMVNSARSFSREVLTLMQPPSEEEKAARHLQEDLVRRMIAYTHSLRHHLRESTPFEELANYIPGEELALMQSQKNVPNAILLDIARRVARAVQNDWLSEYDQGVIERTLTDISNVQGGCERIKNTPIPFTYTILTHRIVASYLFSLPFGIVHTVGWLTPVVVLLISHAFLGLDDIGDEIDQPFGTEPQHLPLTALCRTIEVNLLQSIDVEDVPALLQPVNGILE